MAAMMMQMQLPEAHQERSQVLRLARYTLYTLALTLASVLVTLRLNNLEVVMSVDHLPGNQRTFQILHPWAKKPGANITSDSVTAFEAIEISIKTLKTMRLMDVRNRQWGPGLVLAPSHMVPVEGMFPVNKSTGHELVEESKEEEQESAPTVQRPQRRVTSPGRLRLNTEYLVDGGTIGSVWGPNDVSCGPANGGEASHRDFVALYEVGAANVDYIDFSPVLGRYVRAPAPAPAGAVAADEEEEQGAINAAAAEPPPPPPNWTRPPRTVRWKHVHKINFGSVLWLLHRGGWPFKRIGMHPKHPESLYARVTVLPPPDDGLYAIPYVNVLMEEVEEEAEEGARWDPASQSSVWTEHIDAGSGRPFFINTVTSQSTWLRDHTDLPAGAAWFTVRRNVTRDTAWRRRQGRDGWARFLPWGLEGPPPPPVLAPDPLDEVGINASLRYKPPAPQYELRYWCNSTDGYVLGARSTVATLLQPAALKWEHPSLGMSRSSAPATKPPPNAPRRHNLLGGGHTSTQNRAGQGNEQVDGAALSTPQLLPHGTKHAFYTQWRRIKRLQRMARSQI